MVDDEIISLPPGYRFYPSEEELISFYLREKIEGRRQDLDRVIPVLYIYDYNPWDLPQLAGEQCRGDPQRDEWFFFIPRPEREARGGRPNRLTETGYWKATGSASWVFSSSDHRVIGVKRTMVFYSGRARTRSDESKTEWKMNEFMAVDPNDLEVMASSSSFAPTNPPFHKGEFTVCRVYNKAKCVRSFDRRPVAGPPLARTTILSHHHYAEQQPPSSSSSEHHQDQPRLTVDRGSLNEGSSSSGQDANNVAGPSQGTNDPGSSNVDIEIDQEPLWDWDSLTSLNWDF